MPGSIFEPNVQALNTEDGPVGAEMRLLVKLINSE
jgi:hypothetical protein